MARRHRPTESSSGPRDSVDAIVDGWRAVRDDLDVSPVAVVARLSRTRAVLDQELESLFADFGLTTASFAALAAVARLGGETGVTQVRLMRELRLTSGTISVRIDRLVADGLVARRVDPDDRRGTRISLTAAGRDLFERAAPAHLDNERRLLSALDPDEQRTLAGLLRKLLIDLENGAASGDDPARRLGLGLMPAHATVAMRRAVGLPECAGLLVRTVDRDGPAARAGVAAGDVLVRLGGHDVPSLVALHDALVRVEGERAVAVEIMRGQRRVSMLADLAQGGAPPA
jgi:DNA-binding MarR family transcriptional regulator